MVDEADQLHRVVMERKNEIRYAIIYCRFEDGKNIIFMWFIEHGKPEQSFGNTI